MLDSTILFVFRRSRLHFWQQFRLLMELGKNFVDIFDAIDGARSRIITDSGSDSGEGEAAADAYRDGLNLAAGNDRPAIPHLQDNE